MHYNKIFSIMVIILLTSILTVSAAPRGAKNVHIFYRVQDGVLSCQNKEEDIVNGRREFEQTIRKYYEKRFFVGNIEQAPNEKAPIQYYLSKCSPGQTALVISLKLEGESTQSELYRNGYGAETNATSPTVLVHLVEFIAISGHETGYIYDYATQSYGKGTFAIGKYVFVADNNARTNTKAAVEGCLRDVCEFNVNKINKYANEEAYKIEQWRYSGDFDKISQVQDAKNEQIKARVEKFRNWCNSDPNMISVRMPLIQMLDMYSNNPSMQNAMINQWITLGTYIEQ